MPLRRGPSQLRASSSDSEPLRSRPLTDRSPKLLSDRRSSRSPRGTQSDPLAQKKLGSRISDLENQLGLAQEELKCLKDQLASTQTAKKPGQEKPEKKTKKQTVHKPEEIPNENQESNEKENMPEPEILDDSQQETDVFEVPVEKVAMMDTKVEDIDEDEVNSKVPSPSIESFEKELALKNEEINSLRAELEEKGKKLENFHQENEFLKQQLNDKSLEASSAKAKEEESSLELKQVREELETTRGDATKFNEKLEESEKVREALETEMKKMRVQTEQWRKAADAAATVLSGGMEMSSGRRMSERCGSMEKYGNSVFEPVGGYGSYMGYLDDSEDFSESGKKKGSGIKMLGDLWKKKNQK